MHVEFRSIKELTAGRKWADHFRRFWPAYRRWYLREGEEARPSLARCRQALGEYFPDLVPTWERLVELAGGSDLAARFLSFYRPPAYISGCSQAIWSRGDPILIRNYDYNPRFWEGTLFYSAWNELPVVALTDCAWGALDGINGAGLCVSLAFGGTWKTGDGFGIPLLLRQVLESCSSTAEATRTLARLPSHMAYNVTLLDRQGRFATVRLSPGRKAVISRRPVATNHQSSGARSRFAKATRSRERERFLLDRLEDSAESRRAFVRRFLAPPILSPRFASGWGTLYTAAYEPLRGRISLKLAGHRPRLHSFDDFTEERILVRYREEP